MVSERKFEAQHITTVDSSTDRKSKKKEVTIPELKMEETEGITSINLDLNTLSPPIWIIVVS